MTRITMILSPLVALAAMGCNNTECPADYTLDEELGQCLPADSDGDGAIDLVDCAPDDPAVYPGALEVCDGVDNNCDGLADDDDGNLQPGPGEGGATLYYADLDGDGAAGNSVVDYFCAQPEGYALEATDCDDFNPAAFPGGTEVCDGADNDCNGEADEAGVCADAQVGDITIGGDAGAAALCEDPDFNGVVYGSVTISGYSFTDLSSVDCITEIYGHLTIDTPLVVEPALANLTYVEGDITPSLYEDTVSFSLPNLTNAGVVYLEKGEALATVDFGSLETAAGVIYIGLPMLESIELPSATNVGGLYSWDNSALTAVNAPNMTTLGALDFYYNESLESLDLSQVTELGDATLTYNYELADFNVSGADSIGSVWFEYNPSLGSLDLTNATAIGSIVLDSNDALSSVEWTVTEFSGDLLFMYNDSLDMPDHTGVTSVGGDWGAWYQGWSDLSTLADLTTLEGTFTLYNNGVSELPLDNLETLGGVNFQYEDFSDLDLSGITNPMTTEFVLRYNYDLQNFSEPTIGDLEGDLIWDYNYNMYDDIDLSTATGVGGTVQLREVYSEVDLSGLEYVDGDVYLYYVYGDVDLSDVAEIGGSYSNYYQYYNTTDLSGVESIGGDMRWYYTAYYSSSDVDVGADNLTEIGGQLYLSRVAGYYGGNVSAEFPSLTTLGSVYAYENARAAYQYYGSAGDFTLDLSSVESIDGDVELNSNGESYYNYYSNNMAGEVMVDLSSVTEIGGQIYAYENGYCYGYSSSYYCDGGSFMLTADALTSVGGQVYLYRNGYANYGYGGDVMVSLPSVESADYLYARYNGYSYVRYDSSGAQGGDVTIDMSSVTDLDYVQVDSNGYAYGYYLYGASAYGGQVSVDLSSLESADYVDVYYNGYTYAYYGYAYGGDVDLDIGSLGETGDLYLNYNGYGDGWYNGYNYGTFTFDASALTTVDYLSLNYTGAEDLDGFGSLDEVGDWYMYYNYNLSDLDGGYNGTTLDYFYAYQNNVSSSTCQNMVNSWSSVNYSYCG